MDIHLYMDDFGATFILEIPRRSISPAACMALALNSSAMEGSKGKTMPKFNMSIKTIRYLGGLELNPCHPHRGNKGRNKGLILLCLPHLE